MYSKLSALPTEDIQLLQELYSQTKVGQDKLLAQYQGWERMIKKLYTLGFNYTFLLSQHDNSFFQDILFIELLKDLRPTKDNVFDIFLMHLESVEAKLIEATQKNPRLSKTLHENTSMAFKLHFVYKVLITTYFLDEYELFPKLSEKTAHQLNKRQLLRLVASLTCQDFASTFARALRDKTRIELILAQYNEHIYPKIEKPSSRLELIATSNLLYSIIKDKDLGENIIKLYRYSTPDEREFIRKDLKEQIQDVNQNVPTIANLLDLYQIWYSFYLIEAAESHNNPLPAKKTLAAILAELKKFINDLNQGQRYSHLDPETNKIIESIKKQVETLTPK